MSRFLLATMPFIGHINPGLPVARELIKQGHEVRWYSGRKYQAKIESTGAHFVPFKAARDFDDSNPEKAFPESEKLTSLARLKYDLKHVFIDSAVGQLEDLKEILRVYPADVIIADVTVVGVSWLSEMGGPPWATLSHLPPSFSSRDVAPFGLALQPKKGKLGRLRNTILNKLTNSVIFRDVMKYGNKVRASVGLPSQKINVMDGSLSPYLFLQATVPGFEYPRSDMPEQMHFIGPLLPPAPDRFTPPAWWQEMVTSTRPVVHVTQGTLQTESGQLLVPTIRALAEEDVLVVVTTGGKPVETLNIEQLPANVRVESFIPHHYLLPYVDCMVTNGGYNGVQIALANGVPLVGAGASEDKPEVCNRIAWSGAGINLRTNTPIPDQVRQAVMKILSEPHYRERAKRIQAEIANYNAPVLAAQLLVKLAETQQPVIQLETEGSRELVA